MNANEKLVAAYADGALDDEKIPRVKQLIELDDNLADFLFDYESEKRMSGFVSESSLLDVPASLTQRKRSGNRIQKRFRNVVLWTGGAACIALLSGGLAIKAYNQYRIPIAKAASERASSELTKVRTQLNSGNFEEALTLIHAFDYSGKYSDFTDIRFELALAKANALNKIGRSQEAEEFVIEFFESRKDLDQANFTYSRLLFALGAAQRDQGKFDESLQSLKAARAAVAGGDKQFESGIDREILSLAQRWENLELLEATLRNSEHVARDLRLTAYLMDRTGDTSIDYLEFIVSYIPVSEGEWKSNLILRANLAGQYLNAQRIDKAKAELDKVQAVMLAHKSPLTAHQLFLLGGLASHEDDLDKASMLFEKAKAAITDSSPRRAIAAHIYCESGRLQSALGNHEQAKLDFKDCIAISKRFPMPVQMENYTELQYARFMMKHGSRVEKQVAESTLNHLEPLIEKLESRNAICKRNLLTQK